MIKNKKWIIGLMAIGIMLNLHCSGMAAPLFDDNFTNMNNWQQATSPLLYTNTLLGKPDVTNTGDGAQLVSHWTDLYQSRGFETIQTFSGLTSAQATLRFKTGGEGPHYGAFVSNIDGLMNLSLISVSNGNRIGFSIAAADHGGHRIVGYASQINENKFHNETGGGKWDYDHWYRFSIDVQPTHTILKLLNDDGTPISGATMDITNFGMNELGNGFKLALYQGLGYINDLPGDIPRYYADATVNNLQLVPLPGTLPLLGSGLLGLFWYRRFRKG